MMDWILKPTLLLALAGAVHLLTRRAAARHFAWTLAFAGLMTLPFAPGIPRLRTTVLPVPAPAIVHTVESSLASPTGEPPLQSSNAPSSKSGNAIRDGILLLWALGVAVSLGRLVPGLWKVRRLTSEGTPAGNHGRARILEHQDVATPFTWGVLRPVILLPAGADWTPDRRQNVLAHEYAHIVRADWLTQSLAQVVCAMYWFHPLVWLAALWMRRTSEQACDDAVVRDGRSPEGYAEHLLDLAKSDDRKFAPPPPVAVAMWNRSQLEERIMRILEQHDRRGLGKLAAAGMTILAIAMIAPIAAVRLQAQTKTTSTLRGVVNDPSGARVPNARISLLSRPSGGARVTTTADTAAAPIVTQSGPDGSYQVEVPAGVWFAAVEKPGFVMMARTIIANERTPEITSDFTLNLGQLNETVGVAGVRPANKPAQVAPAKAPVRIRVGGNVQAANLIQRTNPEYPKDLQSQGIEGTVELEAVISKEGNILNLHPRSKVVNEGLVQAAMAAVKTWQYKPTLLNGEPVEVVTTVTVRFFLQ